MLEAVKQKKPPLNSASSSTLPVASDGEKSNEQSSKATAPTEKIVDDTRTSVTVKSEGEAEEKEKDQLKADSGKPGLLVTPELLKVIEDCRSRVETIAKECRATNTKYR